MYVIVGASGKVGASSAAALRKAGRAVRAAVRMRGDGEALARIGCEVAIVDLEDPPSLQCVLDGAQARPMQMMHTTNTKRFAPREVVFFELNT